jgi:hypothetical protein
MKLKNVKFIGGGGWKGDVKNMLLDINKFKVLGRGPKLNSQQAIRKTAKEMFKNNQVCKDQRQIFVPTINSQKFKSHQI